MFFTVHRTEQCYFGLLVYYIQNSRGDLPITYSSFIELLLSLIWIDHFQRTERGK